MWRISRAHIGFLRISSKVVVEVFSINDIDAFRMPAMLMMWQTKCHTTDIALMWVTISSHGGLKSKKYQPGLAQDLNIEPWLILTVRCSGFPPPLPIQLYCDNEDASFIANNETFHMRIKHIKIDCHFIRHYVLNMTIYMPHFLSTNQLAYIFTKSLTGASYDVIERSWACLISMIQLERECWT